MEDRVVRTGTGTEQSMGEWAKSESRDLADAARQRTYEVRREAKDYAAEARDYVQGAVQQTKEYVGEAREYVGDAVQQARDKMTEYRQQARDKMTEYREGGIERVKDDVVGYTREQPMTALLIAAGAGLVLGWLSTMSRR